MEHLKNIKKLLAKLGEIIVKKGLQSYARLYKQTCGDNSYFSQANWDLYWPRLSWLIFKLRVDFYCFHVCEAYSWNQAWIQTTAKYAGVEVRFCICGVIIITECIAMFRLIWPWIKIPSIAYYLFANYLKV